MWNGLIWLGARNGGGLFQIIQDSQATSLKRDLDYK
jgi:hypothetical protein